MGTTYFTDDDLRVLSLRVRGLEFGHVVEQVRFQGRYGLVDVDVGALHVVVHVDEVKGAAVAGIDEIGEVGETASVGDGGRGQLGSAGKWLHIVLVDRSGVSRFEVGLADVVGFVGGEERFGVATADEVGYRIHPLVVLETTVDVKGGDEAEGRVEGDAVADYAVVSPVGAPADVFAAFEHVAVGGLGIEIVHEPALR